MTNFIVPIDFSETSKNAARYAAHLSANTPDVHLILYNLFDALEYGSDSSPQATDKDEDEGRKTIMELALQSVRTDLSNITPTQRSPCVAEENNHFVNTTGKLCAEQTYPADHHGNYRLHPAGARYSWAAIR